MNNNTEILELEITQEDIDKGVPHDIYLCVISQAAKRQQVPDFWYTSIDGELKGMIDKVGICTLWKCPEASELVRAFDNKEEVKPTKLIYTKTK